MTIVVDATIAMAMLNPADPFHRQALRRCLSEDDVAMLNISLTESLIHPTQTDMYFAASAELDRLGIRTEMVDDGIADRARVLRAKYGRKRFSIIDAAVVALGVERGWPIVTCQTEWPQVAEATIERLAAN